MGANASGTDSTSWETTDTERPAGGRVGGEVSHKDKPSIPHLERIGAVLDALGDVSPALGIVILQDTQFALQLGVSGSMTLDDIRRLHVKATQSYKGNK